MSLPKEVSRGVWRVSYSDGNGNSYRFWQASTEDSPLFAYDPITPEQSSSGFYSGGKPCQGTLEPAQVEALFQWLDDLRPGNESQSTMRRKGTGSFRINVGGSQSRFILGPSKRLADFDSFLRDLRI